MLFIAIMSSAQESYKVRVWVKSDDARPALLKSPDKLTGNDKLNRIFKKHSVYYYEQACPFAKNPELLKIHIIKLNGDAEELRQDLKNNASDLFSNVAIQPKPVLCYNPSDYMWTLTLQDTTGWLWHLKKIQADKAWDITQGSASVHVAVEDTWFDINHPDLTTKISPHYDLYSKSIGQEIDFTTCGTCENHGTITSSFVGAQTNGGGQLASVGFNTMMYALDYNDYLDGALYAADVLHADVLSISWFNYCYNEVDQDTRTSDSLEIKEILDAGTIIVAAAGNGYEGASCSQNNNNRPPFQPLYPFSNTYDSRVICVSSTDTLDYHQFFNNGVEITHSYYPQVDICSPGYNTMGAVCTQNADGSTNTWPYYGFCKGTSFATPIVSGVCALMKSIDPYLTPVKAKAIIKANADPIADANLYTGMVGAGRINAYKCVMATDTKSISNTTLTGTSTYTAGYSANLSQLTVQNNANINVTSRHEINLGYGFEVKLGSTINFTIDPNAVNSNNW